MSAATLKTNKAVKKKDYQKPAMRVVKIQQQAHLLYGSEVKSVSSSDDTGIGYGGGGDGTSSGGGPARSRSFGDWDE